MRFFCFQLHLCKKNAISIWRPAQRFQAFESFCEWRRLAVAYAIIPLEGFQFGAFDFDFGCLPFRIISTFIRWANIRSMDWNGLCVCVCCDERVNDFGDSIKAYLTADYFIIFPWMPSAKLNTNKTKWITLNAEVLSLLAVVTHIHPRIAVAVHSLPPSHPFCEIRRNAIRSTVNTHQM